MSPPDGHFKRALYADNVTAKLNLFSSLTTGERQTMSVDVERPSVARTAVAVEVRAKRDGKQRCGHDDGKPKRSPHRSDKKLN
ncbi:hypothetical protein OUZ56_007532 [Daphnia magna]|uniref:Uncharacterized protein n=1 Tax=Daphnia magna TaxID=35525 RepID=A0ABR0AAJ0_9CRUS|nr:hypothetical protein OUZ56_007532 [Daphnia magna]